MLTIPVIMCLLMLAIPEASAPNYDDVIWADYEINFNKTYTVSEEQSRRAIFEHAMAKIRKHNEEADRGLHTYWEGETPFTDWTLQEFEEKIDGYHDDSSRSSSCATVHEAPRRSKRSLPREVDWRERGYVTPIKYQGSCASCWAFTAAAAIEGQIFGQTGRLESLSVQNLIDCSVGKGNIGCQGGWPDIAFEYIIDNNGIVTEKCYPYQAQEQKCNFSESCIGGTISGYKVIKHNDETALQDAIAKVGPISVAMDSNHESFMYYKRGIYDEPECSTTNMTHAMLVVGYGVQNGTEYYICKNSFGTNWGMDGYIWMSRNKNNQCGIARNASYPIV